MSDHRDRWVGMLVTAGAVLCALGLVSIFLPPPFVLLALLLPAGIILLLASFALMISSMEKKD